MPEQEKLIQYQINIPKEKIEGLRKDEKFSDLLILGHALNLLRFSMLGSYAQKEKADEVFLFQQNVTSIFFVMSILWELFGFIQNLGKNFRDLPSYKGKISPLIKKMDEKKFREKLDCFRNQVAFHLDRETALKGFENLEMKDYPFAKVDSDLQFGWTYPLSSIVMLMGGIKVSNTSAEDHFYKWIKETNDEVKSFTGEMIEGLENIILEGLREIGFERIDSPRSEIGAGSNNGYTQT